MWPVTFVLGRRSDRSADALGEQIRRVRYGVGVAIAGSSTTRAWMAG